MPVSVARRRHSAKLPHRNTGITSPTFKKQSFREFKKLNAPPKAGRSLGSVGRR